MDRIAFLPFPKASETSTKPLLTQQWDGSATRLYSSMRKDRRVEWSQAHTSPSTARAGSKSGCHKGLLAWLMDCFWIQTALEVTAAIPLCCQDDSRPAQTLRPIDSASLLCWMRFSSVLMKHSLALMLLFESVRSQMPSGCCNKWEVPTDCKGKWGCLLLCIWTILFFQEGKGRNWGEQRCCSSSDLLELAMVHCFSLLWEHRPASYWGQVLHQTSSKSHRGVLTSQLCVSGSQHSSQPWEKRKFPAGKEKSRLQMYSGTNFTYSKYRQKFSPDFNRS